MGNLRVESVALLILRAFVGLAFILHGYGKIHTIRLFAAKFELPFFVAVLVVYAQLIGGVMLIFGMLTSAASAAIAVTMLGAVFKCKARGERFIDPEHHSWETAGVYLVLSIVIAILGPGSYSLDRILFG